MSNSKDIALVLRLVEASQVLADRWRRNAARESVGGQEALTRWRDISTRGRALAGAAADRKVRVAVMGRVKAGKSTLLNALFARPVAATHAFEQTSAIHEIAAVASGGEEWGRIWRRGVAEQFSPEGLASLCADHRGDAAFWADIERLETQVNAAISLALAFFDTPGVGTLGAGNVNRTNDFLDGAHIVLWVQSGQSLGNAEDRRFLDELVRRGRPILPVITRADLLDEDERADAKTWFKRTFPTLPAPILANSPHWMAGSPERKYLLDELEAQVAAWSVQGSVAIERLKLDLEAASDAEQADIKRLCTVFSHVDQVVGLMKQRVRGAIEDAVADQVDHLFDREWSAIREEIQAQVRSRSAASGLINEAFQRHLGEERVRVVLQGVEQATRARLEEEWGRALAKALDDLGEEVSGVLVEGEAMRLDRMKATLSAIAIQQTRENTVAKVAVGGAALGGAAYVAWFGANAAAVSIGSALATVALPVVAIGIVGLAIKRWFWDPAAARNEAEAEAQRFIVELREVIKADVINAQFLPALRSDIETVGDGVAAMFVREIAGGVDRSELMRAEVFFGHLAARQYEAALSLAPSLPMLGTDAR
jgi:GTP-binding protein EngB required for normal cell division